MNPLASTYACFPVVCPKPIYLINTSVERTVRKNDLFYDVCSTIKPTSILEIGSWMGASAIAWKQSAQLYNQDSKVYCIDTWLGSPEHYLNAYGAEWNMAKLAINERGPQFFDIFLANIHKVGYEDSILPLRATSSSALPYLCNTGALFDVVYVDGAHDEISVFRDVTMGFKVLRDGGMLCGDDFGWASVRMGLFLASYDSSTPKLDILYRGSDFVAIPKTNHIATATMLDLGYVRWNSRKEIARLVAFSARKLLSAIKKL